MSQQLDHDARPREVILRNERERSGYVVEPHYWSCSCGARCDYREVSQ